MRHVRLALVVWLLLWHALVAQDQLDAVVEQVRKTFDVPGIAVGIVKDGKLIFAKGYGVRKLGEPAPVTPETLFGIASNTKAFTAAAIAILVDRGKLQWDDPVCKHLPDFQLYDPYVTREMTIRDLLCHRSGLGLGAGDLMFFPASNLKREEIFARLRHIKPASSFRSQFGYSNLMFLVAGQVIEKVSGKSWEDFIVDEFFKKLGMTSSNTSVTKHQATDNVAFPHAKEDGKLVVLPFEPLDNCAAAGAINSNVVEVSKWVMAQLAEGEYNGGRLFSSAQSHVMWSAHTPIPISPKWELLRPAKPNFQAYGLGWMLSDYRGQKLVWHTGGLAGMVTRITLVPSKKMGVIVLTNQEQGGAFDSITHTILDHHLGAESFDWVKAFEAVKKHGEARADATTKKAADGRHASSKPSLPIKSYAGRFRDAWYGDISITEKDGQLEIRFSHTPELVGKLEHWQYDTFVAKWHKRSLLADAYVTFSLKPDGSLEQAKMVAISPLTDFSFDFHDLLLRPVPDINAKPW